MSEEPKLSRHEWERERAAELAAKTTADLASKVAALEFDLKAKRSELDTLKTQLPPEGSVVLRGAEKDRWEAYSALGKPDDLKAALADRDTLTAEKAQRDRRDSIRAAAEVVGYKARVLERLAPEGAAFEVREGTDTEGNPTRTAFIRVGEQETPLTDWAATDPDFLPALVVTADKKDESRPSFPRQTTDGNKPKSGGLAQEQNRRAASHLRPKPN